MFLSYLINCFVLQWEFEKWKFGAKNQVMFFSCQTGKALRIKPDAVVDALGDENSASGECCRERVVQTF